MNRTKSEETSMRCIVVCVIALVVSILYCIGMALVVPESMI